MIAKLAVIAVLALVLYNLFRALFYLIKDTGDSKRTVNALSYRIGLSIVAVLMLIFAGFMGWIEPHGVSGEKYAPPKIAPANPE